MILLKKNNYITRYFIVICIISFFIDFVSKRLVLYFFKEYNTVSVISNFFSITLSKNKGVAFSMLYGHVYLIIVLTFLFIVFIVRSVLDEKKSDYELVCYGMIVGGACGNLFDRFFYGYVVDFLDFNIFGWDYPVFNLADSFIVIGVILLLFYSFRKGEV